MIDLPSSTAESPDAIQIHGAREHNLKNVSLTIPRDRFVVITGVSGSGKSTLAFDLLFAEGQRRFLDSMNTYARQFVEQMARPDVDLITGIPPTVSIEQRTSRGGGKSTVATVTEIHHFIRLLFARIGTQHCPECGVAVESQTRDELARRLVAETAKRGDLLLLAPVVKNRKGFHSDVGEWAARHGYAEVRADGRIHPTAEPLRLDRFREHDVEIVIGVLEAERRRKGRKRTAKPVAPGATPWQRIDEALKVGKGTLYALDNARQLTVHSTERACPRCGRSFTVLDPKLFSYNSAQGWCPQCRGFGELFELPDVDRGARADAIEESWFEWTEGRHQPCPSCHGARLNPLARAVRLHLPRAKGKRADDLGIDALGRMPVGEALALFRGLAFTGAQREIARDILPEIIERLKFLQEVGLGYLHLGRAVPTLSGGEAQRIRLAAQLGSNLSGVLYVLDEPTIGLHARDNDQLLHALEQLRRRGNSVVVVEHDEETMRRADWIIDLGPGAGVQGGQVVAAGTLDELSRHPESITGQCLRMERRFPARGARRRVSGDPETAWLQLGPVSANNLKGLTVRIPLGRFVVVTGVSGSGKSTLVRECLLPGLRHALEKGGANAEVPITGWEGLRAVYEVDQSPIGRTPRSTPATYVGFFNEIRELFAQTPEARMRGYGAARFSFNSAQGRCPGCDGAGVVKLEMNFLPAAYVPCETCRGTRFNPETLDIELRGRNIGQVLDLSVEEAIGFFGSHSRILRPLEVLRDTGLGYLRLGQTSPTLSGGEAQRVKLVTHLLTGLKDAGGEPARRIRPGPARKNLFLLEEPTVGLHMSDVRRLVDIIQRLVDGGHSVVVIEHNLDLIAEADWLLDLGPEGGEGGGQLVDSGTPEEIGASRRSHTGRYLKPLLARAGMLLLGVLTSLLSPVTGVARAQESPDFPKVYNTQPETIPLLKPSEVPARIHLPPGFQATLFAGEPDVQQPIGLCTDARGRLWVAENYTYSENAVNFHPTLRDRVVILEDRDHDGHFDHRTVFWDQGRKLTSVCVGFGGAFVLCPPRLLFIPDRNGDDVPDGEPEVLLDGWSDGAIRHTIVNGLKWGPDGWLYGRHGIQATSRVGRPGTPDPERTPINVGLWRYHPVTHAFEVVAQGTTNPWGHDWDDYGQLFFINTVIGHLWHVIPGAYYRRMYGEHFNPSLYELIDQTADHVHWDTRETWDEIRKLGVTATTSQAGGGHAHSGLMVYLGDNWPDRYRNTLFAVNYHGKRLNNDVPLRQGATYIATHAPDFMTVEDPWFRGIDLLTGPDGGVYVSDWSDIGECHDHDGIHRTSGRIYKITYGIPKPPSTPDLSRLTDEELANLQGHRNDWQVRQARTLLQERAARGADMTRVQAALRRRFEEQAAVPQKLRALWALHVTGGADPAWLEGLWSHPDEHIRLWALRLRLDTGSVTGPVVTRLARWAAEERSGLVLCFLASTLQRIPAGERWPLAEALATHAEFAQDRVFPLMLWYGIQPAVLPDPPRATQFAAAARVPKVRQFVARHLVEDWENAGSRVAGLLPLLGPAAPAAQRVDVLSGIAEAVRGRHGLAPPSRWSEVATSLAASGDPDIRRLLQQLGALFGDGRAVEELKAVAGSPQEPVESRRAALAALSRTRAPQLGPVLTPLLEEAALATEAIKAFAALGLPETPRTLVAAYARLGAPARAEVINALASRSTFAGPLLDAVKAGVIPRDAVTAVHHRQLRSLHNPAIDRQLAELWPGQTGPAPAKQQALEALRKRFAPERLGWTDKVAGRRLFLQTCGTCHRLHGEGGQIGPDLTGSDRTNLDYLLDNIVDPSGVVPDGYRMSIVTLKDGRVLNGIAGTPSGRTLEVQTVTERLTLERAEIESVQPSSLSMMPEGLLDALSEEQARNLMGYLMSKEGR
jgi:putative membrane-bound dehydrogenase-like protein